MSPSTRSLLAGMGLVAALLAPAADGAQPCDQGNVPVTPFRPIGEG